MSEIPPFSDEEQRRQEHRDMYRRLGRWFIYSGWVVAFLSMVLGSYLLNGFHRELVRLKAENTHLKTEMAENH